MNALAASLSMFKFRLLSATSVADVHRNVNPLDKTERATLEGVIYESNKLESANDVVALAFPDCCSQLTDAELTACARECQVGNPNAALLWLLAVGAYRSVGGFWGHWTDSRMVIESTLWLGEFDNLAPVRPLNL